MDWADHQYSLAYERDDHERDTPTYPAGPITLENETPRMKHTETDTIQNRGRERLPTATQMVPNTNCDIVMAKMKVDTSGKTCGGISNGSRWPRIGSTKRSKQLMNKESVLLADRLDSSSSLLLDTSCLFFC